MGVFITEARARISYLKAIAESIALDHVSMTVLHFRRRRRRHRCRSRRLLAVTVGARTLVSGWCRIMGRRSKLHRHYYDPKRVGSYGGVAALQRVVPAERNVERWLSTQDAYTLHKPVRRHFKRRCVVVGGPNQQWQADLVDMSRLKAANDGTTFLLTVIDVFSKRAWCVPLKSKSAASLVAAFRQLLDDNNRPTTWQTDKGFGVFEPVAATVAETVRRASLCDAQRGDEGEHRRALQQDLEDAHVALFHEEPDDPLRRRAAGFRAFVQQHLSSQHRYGSVGGERRKSGNGVAAVVRAGRRRRHAQVSSRRSRAHKQGETSLRERLHGELDGRIVYDRRGAPFGSARVSIGRLARRSLGRHLLRTRTTEGHRVGGQDVSS